MVQDLSSRYVCVFVSIYLVPATISYTLNIWLTMYRLGNKQTGAFEVIPFLFGVLRERGCFFMTSKGKSLCIFWVTIISFFQAYMCWKLHQLFIKRSHHTCLKRTTYVQATFSKTTVIIEPKVWCWCPLRFRISKQIVTMYFLWLIAPFSTIRAWPCCKYIFTKDDLTYVLMTEVFVEKPLALPRSAKYGIN